MLSRSTLSSLVGAGLLFLGLVPAAAQGPQGTEEKVEGGAVAAESRADTAAGDRQDPPETSGEAATQGGQEPSAEQPSGQVGRHQQPPDGVWLVDEQNRQYFVDALSKEGLAVRRLSDDRVRISWGITLDLVGEDDEYFYFKIYRTDHIRVEQQSRGPSEDDKTRVKAAYRMEVPETDHLVFRPAGEGLPETGQWRNGFEVADMNGDGNLDIVHGPPRKAPGSSPLVFLGDGRGSWKLWQEARFPQLPYDYGDVAVGDFNGDSKLDLAVANHLRGLLMLVGDGAGSFRQWSEGVDFSVTGDQPAFSSRALVADDWNGDGRADVLAVGEGPSLRTARGPSTKKFSPGSFGAIVYQSSEDGRWTRRGEGDDGDFTYGDSITTGDFNGDGQRDIATGSNVLGLTNFVYLGKPDGSWDVLDVDVTRPQAYVRAVRAADFDGDGRDELVVAYLTFEAAIWHRGIDVLSLGPNREWSRRPVFAEQNHEGVYALAAGDLDGDSLLDIAGLSSAGETLVFLGRQDGSFAREKTPEIPPETDGCRGYHAEIADFDKDGKGELLVAFAGEPSLYHPEHCRHLGSLRAWDGQPVEEAAGGEKQSDD